MLPIFYKYIMLKFHFKCKKFKNCQDDSSNIFSSKYVWP